MRAPVLIPFLLALVAGKLALDRFSDPDLYWHLRLGLDMLERGTLPEAVEYAWTAEGEPYLANDWLAQIAWALSFRAGGFPGVALLEAACAVLLALLVYGAAWIRTGNPRASGAAAALAILLGATSFMARPLLLGAVLFAAQVLCVELVFKGRRWVAIGLPVLFALWVNVHGSWPFGLAVLTAYGLGSFLPARSEGIAQRIGRDSARRPLLLALAASLGAVFANPFGFALVERPFALLSRGSSLGPLVEWSPVPFSDPSAWILLAAGLAFAAACWRGRKIPEPLELLVVVASFAMACFAARHHLLFAVVLAPALAAQLGLFLDPEGLHNRDLNLALAGLAGLMLGGVGAVKAGGIPEEIRAGAPVEAVDALQGAGLAGERGFHHFDFGGYLVFRQVPTFVDGRLEPFLRAGTFARYLELEARPDLAALEREEVRWILARAGTRMAEAAANAPGWRALHRDRLCELFVREP